MKNLTIHLFCILLMSFLFQKDVLANPGAVESPEKVAQIQPSNSVSAQSASARLSREIEFEYQAGEPGDPSPWDFLAENWGVLALAFITFLEVGARLTPTEKDNTLLKIISTVLDMLIPNLRKGGGVF